jgi:aminopeptidase N
MARFTVTILADKAKYPVLLANGNLVASQICPAAGTSAKWVTPSPSPPTSLPWWPATWCGSKTLHHRLGARGALHIYVEERNRDLCAHAMASLKKAMRWDEETFGLEYDLDIYMIVAVDDFNMGAMENKGLNIFNSKYVLANPRPPPTPIPGDRGGDRPRVFPQLDRQPGHLPRLVPALAQGGADGLSRPGVLRRHDQPGGQAHRGGADACATPSSPRTPGPWPIRCAPKPTWRSTTFYTTTVYNKGAELIRMSIPCSAPRASARGCASTWSASTARRRPPTISCRRWPKRGGADLSSSASGTARPARRSSATFVAAFRAALTDRQADPALLALALTLPGEVELGEALAVADPEAVHAARQQLRRTLADALAGDFAAVMATSCDPGPYSLEPAAIGRRSLKNLCLAYLAQGETTTAAAACVAQYAAADNMTDRIAALTCLAHSDLPPRAALLADFYQRYQGDPLVIDKWFTVQATSCRPDTLPQVATLLSHPAFTIKNPNRVRALIGAFAHGNPARFHDPGGAGYAFLADRVIELDPLNPQVAARLVSALSRWRRYDAGRQRLMRTQLERIQAQAGLSRDVGEIIARSLA